MKKSFYGLLLVCVVIVMQCLPAEAAEKSIRGTFLQYQTWVSRLKEQDWISEMETMRGVGIQTVLLQWLKYDQERFFPLHVPKIDPTEIILSYADKHGMKIYLGLWFLSDWWKHWDDRGFLKNTAFRVGSFSKIVWDRYGKHPSVAGFYLPFEIGDSDFEDSEVETLRVFLKDLSSSCRSVAGRPIKVATSVFFAQKLPVPAVEDLFTKIFSGAGLDVVVIQDGMGEQNWDDQAKANVEQYVGALAKAAKKVGARPWVAVEVFRTERDNEGKTTKRVPGQISELLPRIERERKWADEAVFFDFFHYMSPARGAEQKTLFTAYQ